MSYISFVRSITEYLFRLPLKMAPFKKLHFLTLLLMNRNTIDSNILILSLVILLNFLINSNNFSIDFLGSSVYTITYSVYSGSFSLYFPILINFILFTMLSRISSEMLKWSKDNGIFVLFLILKMWLLALNHEVWCLLWKFLICTLNQF